MMLVVGPGRCGTSATACILHNAGIVMGQNFVGADEHNPDGYYEDAEFNTLNNSVLLGQLAVQDWLRLVRKTIKQRREPWGMKDPKTANLIEYYRQLLPDARYIRCTRNFDETVASLRRCYGFGREQARNLVIERENKLDEFLPGSYLTVDVEDHRAGRARGMIEEYVNGTCGA